jgi:hypothetical protein
VQLGAFHDYCGKYFNFGDSPLNSTQGTVPSSGTVPDLSAELEVWGQLARKSKLSPCQRFKILLTNVLYLFYCENGDIIFAVPNTKYGGRLS